MLLHMCSSYFQHVCLNEKKKFKTNNVQIVISKHCIHSRENVLNVQKYYFWKCYSRYFQKVWKGNRGTIPNGWSFVWRKRKSMKTVLVANTERNSHSGNNMKFITMRNEWQNYMLAWYRFGSWKIEYLAKIRRLMMMIASWGSVLSLASSLFSSSHNLFFYLYLSILILKNGYCSI